MAGLRPKAVGATGQVHRSGDLSDPTGRRIGTVGSTVTGAIGPGGAAHPVRRDRTGEGVAA